eukprot:3937729-Rhodomonas_salina.2
MGLGSAARASPGSLPRQLPPGTALPSELGAACQEQGSESQLTGLEPASQFQPTRVHRQT